MALYALVDLSNLFLRARHAVKADDLDTQIGLVETLVFRCLGQLWREFRADHLVVCADNGSWRYGVWSGYKAKRRLAEAARTLAEQQASAGFQTALAALKTYFHEHTRCTLLEHPGIEGDDFIARWIQRHPADDHLIVSSDSDMIQLLGARVGLYDGLQERLITTEAVADLEGGGYQFAVKPENGKLRIGRKLMRGETFAPEPEWWRKALFIKLIRGDASDNIFGAYPGVRYRGSTKRTGISEAWEDRHARGWAWNAFMQHSWAMAVGYDATGQTLTRQVRVHERYLENQQLIDLTCQPAPVKASMDAAIAAALARPLPPQVGLRFLQFCQRRRLPGLATHAAEHAKYLNAGYPATLADLFDGTSIDTAHAELVAPPPAAAADPVQ